MASGIGKLGDWIHFRNGKSSPERSRSARFPVFGSNGEIGRADVTNIDREATVIGRVGSFSGSTWYSPTPAWVTDNAIIATSISRDESRFWYYVLRSLDLNRLSHGSGQPLLNQTILKQIPFVAPAPLERLNIAATLGVLDDKIESNRRTITLLDQLARAQFTKWRVNTVFTEVSNFGQFAQVYGGATPQTKVEEFWGGDHAWATPTDITGLPAPYLFGTSRTITQQGLDSCTAIIHPPGTIFMTSRATIGAFAINQVPAATNQGFIVIRPREELHRWFLFEEMRSRVDEFVGNSNGSTFLEISRGRFKALPLDLPTPAALSELHDSVDPLHTRAAQLAQDNQKLEALRDAFLPELLSGRMLASEAQEIAA